MSQFRASRLSWMGVIVTGVALVGAVVWLAPRNERTAAETASALQRYYPSAPGIAAPNRVVSEFPASFADTLRVSSAGVQVAVRPLDAQSSRVTHAPDGSLIYANAFDSCDVAYRSTPGKTEEFMYIAKPTASASWSWELNIGQLRPVVQANGAIAFLDAQNLPRLQISAPEGKDAIGRVLRCGERLSINLEELSAGRARMTLSADLRGLDFPVAIDPSWTSVTPMNTARADFTATLLANGKILVCGGTNNGTSALNTAELYDPNGGPGGTWTATTGNMVSPRMNHVAVLLGNGKVLLAGGTDGTSDLNSSELFDPSTGNFTATGNMNAARNIARAVLLQTGDVLIIGGGISSPLQSSERYNVTSGTWTTSGNMTIVRKLFTATLLSTGKVLVAGGTDAGSSSFFTSAELYDPSGLGTFSSIASPLITGRYQHQAISVNSGADILLIGGFNNGLFPSTELYDVTNNDFVATGSMTKARTEHRVMSLSNGKVLAVGCHDGSFAQVDLYDPINGGTWSLTGSTLTPHTRHQLVGLQDHRVMVVGGFVGGFSKAAEIFDPRSEPVSTSIAANASNPLSITLQSVTIDDSGTTFPGNTVTTPSHGTLSGTAPNLVYTSTPGYSGPDSFQFQSNDTFGLSNVGTISITVNSLVPTISSTSPDAAIAGTAGNFTLVVNGTNFVTSSKVNWNGSVRPTTYVSTTQLQATISASDVATAGTANVTVVNSAPGGGTSAQQAFSILGGALGQWIVTTTADAGPGSLRMAMNDARSGDSIIFDTTVFALVNSNAATVINLLSPLPDMNKNNITIDASNVRVTVNGSGAGSANGLQLVSNGNTVLGLTLVGFTKDGIFITGNSNSVGGSRALPATGTGPNGQGLRIAGCGAFGIEISSGSQNVIKGNWIGLDASGTASQPNLAGILIQNSGSANQVGSTNADEANVVSGNLYEGITVSGTGTNNNLIEGNVVGASAILTTSRSVGTRDGGDLGGSIGGRSDAGNGSAGIFLSKGTNGTQVGGDTTGTSNAIGYNGGNGVEVRANTSKGNSSKHNGISQNKKGGIALFDGSNNGILPPAFDVVYRTTLITGRATGDDSVGVHIEGHAATDGAVEIFNDAEDQGGNLLGRSSCVGGIWKIDTTASASQNLTATITDNSGNTSIFSIFGPAPAFPTPAFTSTLTVSAVANVSFAYTITATGTQPITFQAANLPDGLSLTGNLITGTPTTPGTYMVHLTATNSAGTTSATLVIVVISSYTMDTDNDGVSDFLETLAGTDPNDPTSTPTQVPLSIDRAQIKVAPSGAGDFINVTMRLTLATSTALGGTANVQIGNVVKSGLTFGGTTKAPKSTTTLSVKSSKQGSGSVVVTFAVRGENLNSGLSPFGLTDTTTPTAGTAVNVPMAVSLKTSTATYVAGSLVKLTYKAKQGKNGTAKK